MIALINIFTNNPNCYNELASQFVHEFPKYFYRIDIMADSYNNLLKRGEQEKSGQSKKLFKYRHCIQILPMIFFFVYSKTTKIRDLLLNSCLST